MSFWVRLWSRCALAALLSGCAFSHPDPASQARLLVSKGRSADAANELELDLQKHPQAVNERRLLIRIYASMGRLDRSEQHARTLAQMLGAASPIPWVELGYALELGHRYDEALAQYDHASEVAPRDALGPLTGGLRAARWGELELAEPRLALAVQRDPLNSEGWHALGLVRAQRGELDGANDAYLAGLRADPRAVEDHVGLATVALLRGNAALALREYDAIVSARPELGDAQLGRAWALVKLGRLDDAQHALNHARELGASPRPLLLQERALRELRLSRAAPPMH
jgi:tetratricopeptide (TPR) repeat protein